MTNVSFPTITTPRDGHFCRALVIASVMILLSSIPEAAAQSPDGQGFDAELFQPDGTDQTGVLGVEGPEVLEHLTYESGMYVHLANDTVQAVDPQRDRVEARLVRDKLKADLGFAIGLFGRLEATVTLPAVLYQSTEQLSLIGRTDSVGSVALADPRATAKLMLLERSDGAFKLGMLGGVSIPSAATRSLNSAGVVHGHTQALVSWAPGWGASVTGNVGFSARPNVEVAGYSRGNAVEFGLAGRKSIVDQLEAVGAIYGERQFVRSAEPQAPPVEALLGVRYDAPGPMMFQVGGGPGLTGGVGAADFRLFVSAHWSNRERDRDGDEIEDRRDDCPDTPGIPELDGCPPQDTDGDTVADRHDECPSKPEDQDGYQDDDGCPDPDNDGDGILDRNDECPDEAGLEVRQGCPEQHSDDDGIPDRKDECPGDPEDFDGYRDDDGCPDRDNDGDGIPDDRDECPDKPETVNGVEDDDGCPDEKKSKAKVVGQKIEFEGRVQFPFNRASVKPQSYDLLEDVAEILREYEHIEKLRIEGHTDDQGDASYNKRLSEKRAANVKSFLVDRGIAETRLIAKGFGESQPLTTNTTPEGRSTNRRVEFEIAQIAEKASSGDDTPEAERLLEGGTGSSEDRKSSGSEKQNGEASDQSGDSQDARRDDTGETSGGPNGDESQ